MALLISALLQRIFLMSSLMLLLVWLIFFIVLIAEVAIRGDLVTGVQTCALPISTRAECSPRSTLRGSWRADSETDDGEQVLLWESQAPVVGLDRKSDV